MRSTPCKEIMHFNPRSPCGERRLITDEVTAGGEFQSTLPLRGATSVTVAIEALVAISIHAPLAGSDKKNITILLPTVFQSTLPLRGAT